MIWEGCDPSNAPPPRSASAARSVWREKDCQWCLLKVKEYEKMGLVSSEAKAEWKTLKHYLTKKPQEDLASQLHELVTLISMLSTLASICV